MTLKFLKLYRESHYIPMYDSSSIWYIRILTVSCLLKFTCQSSFSKREQINFTYVCVWFDCPARVTSTPHAIRLIHQLQSRVTYWSKTWKVFTYKNNMFQHYDTGVGVFPFPFLVGFFGFLGSCWRFFLSSLSSKFSTLVSKKLIISLTVASA